MTVEPRDATGRGALVAPAAHPAGAVDATSADATSASLPVRRNPSHNSVHVGFDNRSVILFVTVCSKDRQVIFATPDAADCIVNAWKANREWIVGQYVIMPDHIHLCCAPGTWPIPDFHRWVAKWKAQVSRTFPGGVRSRQARPSQSRPDCASGRDKHVPPLWQRGCWDTQLRRGENFAAKCKYMRDNPVRAGLVANADEWPYQGRLNNLTWHDKV